MKKSFNNSFSLWILPGLIAGIVFLCIALVTSAMATNFWAMPDAVAHTLGIAAPANYSFALVPVLVGIAIHVVFSIGLGIIFTAFARWRRLRGWLLVLAGLLFIMLETATMLWVVLHSILPAPTFWYFLGAVPWWGSVTGRCVYGLVLGLLLDRFATWQAHAPATQLAEEHVA